MIDIAKNPPTSIGGWKGMQGVHPAIRAEAKVFYDAVDKGSKENYLLKSPKSRIFPEYKVKMQEIADTRDRIAADLELEPYILLSKEQMQDIAITKTTRSLSSWQKDIFDDMMR